MALRVGGARPAPPVEEEMSFEDMPMEDEMPPEEEMPEEMPEELQEAAQEEPTDLRGLVDPAVAGYKGPEMGPFMCANCQYFAGDTTCLLLAAPVDEEGLCNLFVEAQGDQPEAEMPEESDEPEPEGVMPEEMPEEEME